MKLVIFATLLASVVASSDNYLDYSSEEKSSAEDGLHAGPRTTNCSCGWTNKKRIVGGRETRKNEFPLMAALVVKEVDDVFCGASIITNRHALTASHCTDPMEGQPLQLVVGAHDVYAEDDPTKVAIDVEQTIEHEDYDSSTFENDVAIVVLAHEITFTQTVGPVCLPPARFNLVGEWIKVLGWGRLETRGDTSNVLMKVNLKLFNITACANSFTKPINATHPTQLCSYRYKKDSCQGDSGGPLIWLDPQTNRYTQVGLVSFGKTCASRAPSVNTEVAYFMPWIQAKIAATKYPRQTCSKV